MPRYQFLHAAELRLDAPFIGIGRMPTALSALLRDASLRAWEALVETAITRRVAAVLLSGGLCEGLERGVRAQLRLRQGLARLAEHGIAVFVAVGARDAPDGLTAVGGWPAGVVVFAPGTASSAALRRDGQHLATICGAGIAADEGPEAAARRLGRGDQAGPTIALLPSLVGRGGAAIDALRGAGIDYWALGGAADFAILHARDPWLVTPGTPQARALSDEGAHGAALVDVEDGAIARVSLEPLDRVRMASVRIDEAADLPALLRQLDEAAAGLRAAHPQHALVLGAVLGGRAGAARVLRQPDARAAALATLRRGAERDPVWWATLRIGAAGPLAAATDDLAGEVARRRAAMSTDAERTMRFLQRQFEPLRGTWTAALDPRDVDPLLDQAAGLAIDTLGSGEDDGGR